MPRPSRYPPWYAVERQPHRHGRLVRPQQTFGPPFHPHMYSYFRPPLPPQQPLPPPPPPPPPLPQLQQPLPPPLPLARPPGMARHALGPILLSGCYNEAERAQRICMGLGALCQALPPQHHPHLQGIMSEISKTIALLRDLADKSQVHFSRVPDVVNYLNVLLPCLCRTLEDIRGFYEDTSKTREKRWQYMYHKMGEELPGTTLWARFNMYNAFIQLLHFMLARSPEFDLNAIESIRHRILQLREARKIPEPAMIKEQQQQLVRMGSPDLWEGAVTHWAESIFTRPLPYRRSFKKSGGSEAFPPLAPLGEIPMPPETKILVKRSFDYDRLSVVMFLETLMQVPHIMLRCCIGPEPWASKKGVHELCIKQESSSRLLLSRWSMSAECSKPWASLSFVTWEELVLFHCTFVCLKARSLQTAAIRPKEYRIREESLFRAQIIDDRFSHSLMVMKDPATKGLRLHAEVWEGELKHCPVWTAFLPNSQAPDSWIIHKSRHRIWLRNIEPYVFCDEYRPEHQIKGRAGAFELYFAKAEGAQAFKDLFMPTPDNTVATTSESGGEESSRAAIAAGDDDEEVVFEDDEELADDDSYDSRSDDSHDESQYDSHDDSHDDDSDSDSRGEDDDSHSDLHDDDDNDHVHDTDDVDMGPI